MDEANHANDIEFWRMVLSRARESVEFHQMRAQLALENINRIKRQDYERTRQP